MDIPLFSKGQKVINVQKSKLQVELRHLQLEGSKNQLRQDIETAYTNANGAAQSFLANQKSVDASQKAYLATEVRYKAGIASNFDIEQAKQNVGHARGDDGESDVRVHRGNPYMSLLTMGKSAKPGEEFERAETAARFILKKSKLRPKIALVLGSGLGAFADEFVEATRIPYAKIPDFPRSTAIGHAGQLVIGKVDGIEVAGMQGRVHLYEGYSVKDVAYPIRVFARMEVRPSSLRMLPVKSEKNSRRDGWW